MPISLQKGQKISLEKEAGKTLSQVFMGLGWDAKKKKGLFGFGGKEQTIDLDASCVLFDDNNQVLDVVWFKQLQSRDGSLVHSGDNRTGDGDGDDERINVNLSAVPSQVKSLVFVVNSFTGESFASIENAFCRLVDGSNNGEIAKYDLSCNGNHTAMVMAKIYRHNGQWKMHAIGEVAAGKTFAEMMPSIVAHL